MKKRHNGAKRGFTLVELLVVCAILSIISAAIYATFSGGVKIWQRLNTRVAEEDINIFFDKFSSDLRASFRFKGMNFSGAKERFEFPAFVKSPRLEKRTVGGVKYSYNFMGMLVEREEKDYSRIYNGEQGTASHSLKDVASLEFRYYIYDKEQKKYIWQEEYLNEEAPLAVRIYLELDDGAHTRKLIKTVTVPVGTRT
jgi:prepilin-type N-terminal cleavage/methylation domain-containing protein